MLRLALGIVLFLLLAFFASVFVLVNHRAKPLANPADIFGFSRCTPPKNSEIPPIRRYEARDGEKLAYRFYDSTSDKILIFVHGSSYHGAGYHSFAEAIASSGAAKVVLPNLRGHYLSGRQSGDVEYVGQLEDDIADLIGQLQSEGLRGPVYLGGHSSGGGFAIRFAGGKYGRLVSGYVMLAPVIPLPPFMRNGESGGWCEVNLPRIVGLSILNGFGVTGFNGLEVIAFNKPVEFRDGTETLSYSYNLNTSYHPRNDYKSDLRAIVVPAIVLIGSRDQAIDDKALRTAFANESPATEFRIFDGVDHFGVFSESAARQAVVEWLKTR
jgi:non-heme chloroperoxidase